MVLNSNLSEQQFLQILKLVRTADFAPLVVFIAPTNNAPQVLHPHVINLVLPNNPSPQQQLTFLFLFTLSRRLKTFR